MRKKAKHWYDEPDETFGEKLQSELMNDVSKLQLSIDLQLSELKKKKDKLNRIGKRDDTGKKRAKYSSLLPSRYREYLNRSNKKQISLTITVEEFNVLINSDCKYCGCSGGTIDRLDSSIGYDIENCVPSCLKCNMMKYTHSVDVFVKHITKIYKHLNNQ